MAEAKAAKPNPQTKGPPDAPAPENLTAAQVAGLFNLPLAAVLAFKDYGAYVVCVTANGEKLQADIHA